MNKLFDKIHDSLPVFSVPFKCFQIVYTAGSYIILEQTSIASLKEIMNHPIKISNRKLKTAISGIIGRAKQNLIYWDSRKSQLFSPECLTIHVGNECNLNCEYCYSKVSKEYQLKGFPDIERIETAFDYLIDRRKDKTNRIPIVYHGSGEPTYHWNNLVKTHELLKTKAHQKGLELVTYIATNGCLRIDQVNWLAENIDLIGLSCDGPPNIQQRIKTTEIKKYLSLTETCKVLRERKVKYDIRATITPQTLNMQLDIVKYLITELHAKRIRIEPVYRVQDGFRQKDAFEFYTHFKEAQNFARQKDVNLDYSGVRVNELHSTYCDISRNNLRITPEGVFRNCFFQFPDKKEFIIGESFNNKNDIQLSEYLNELKHSAMEYPEICKNCINIFHCSRGCPDFCAYDKESNLNDFKCHLNQLIAVDQIKQMVEKEME